MFLTRRSRPPLQLLALALAAAGLSLCGCSDTTESNSQQQQEAVRPAGISNALGPDDAGTKAPGSSDPEHGGQAGLATAGPPGTTPSAREANAVLRDGEAGVAERVQAGVELATADPDWAVDELVDRIEDGEEELVEEVLGAVGARPFAEIEPFLRELLEVDAIPEDIRLDAVRALADSTPDALPLLLEVAGESADTEVRTSAVESIADLDGALDTSDSLVGLLEAESHPGVRSALYTALSTRAAEAAATPARATLVDAVLNESDAGARASGAWLLAQMLRTDGSPELTASFDGEIVAWLRSEAIESPGTVARRRAVAILSTANTEASLDALDEITRLSDAETAAFARNRLAGAR